MSKPRAPWRQTLKEMAITAAIVIGPLLALAVVIAVVIIVTWSLFGFWG